MTFPADSFEEAVNLSITASNQLHTILNGDSTTEVTVEDGSKIPSVRKAMVDSLYFKPPIAWAQGAYEDTYNQLREFVDGDVRTWWFAKGATVSTPVLMTTNPATDPNWTLWSAVTLNAATYETQKRLAAEAGLNMVGSFLLGGTVTNVGDVVFCETDGKYYGWGGTLPKTVPAGSTPATSGGIGAGAWVDRTDVTSRSELLEEYGASLVGWKRSPLTDRINTVHEMLDAQDYSIWEFSHLVTDKPTINDPNTWDWTPAFSAFNTLINSLPENAKGGVLRLTSGVFMVSNISVTNRMTILGAGIGSTIIRQKSNSIGDLLTIPFDSTLIGLFHFSLDGNKSNNTNGNGIFFSVTNASSGDSKAPINKSKVNNSSYKWCFIDNISVMNNKLSGIKLSTYNFSVFITNSASSFNDNHGIENYSTDNFISNMYLESNGLCGLFEGGGNNKYSNIKSIWNGKIDPSYGSVRVVGSVRSNFSNIEAQDNFTHGFYITDTNDCTFDNLLADSNGYNTLITGTTGVHSGYFLANNAGITLTGKVVSYRSSLADGKKATQYPFILQDYNSGLVDISHDGTVANSDPIDHRLNIDKPSSLLLCKRNSVVTVSGTDYPIDAPAITAGVGLTVSTSDTVTLEGSISSGSNLNFVYEFKWGSAENNSPRLLKSLNGNFTLYLVNSGGTQWYFQVDNKLTDETIKFSSISMTNEYFVTGNTYRLSVNRYIQDNVIYTYMKIYCLDTKTRNITRKRESITPGALIKNIDSIGINLDRGQSANLVARKLFMFSSSVKTGPELEYHSLINNNYFNSEFYYNFMNYYTKTSSIPLSLPAASSFYRGRTLTVEESGIDNTYICRKTGTDTFSWTKITI